MKKICLNCQHFEVCDEDGDLMEEGYCLLLDLFTYVNDEGTCYDWAACEEREEDLRNAI